MTKHKKKFSISVLDDGRRNATVAKGARLAVRCADLMPHTWENTDGSVTLGGCVRSMAWDPFGERLAVIFKGIQVSQERLSQKNVKVHVTTRKVLWVVFRSPQDGRNISVRTRHSGFDEFICLFDLLKCIDYQIPRLRFEIVRVHFCPFSDSLPRNSCICKVRFQMRVILVNHQPLNGHSFLFPRRPHVKAFT